MAGSGTAGTAPAWGPLLRSLTSTEAYAEWQRNQRSAAFGAAREGAALADLIDAQMQELAVLREQAQMQALRETQDFFTSTLYDAFEGRITGGESLNDVLVAEGIRRGLAEYDRFALPLRLRQILADSRRIG